MLLLEVTLNRVHTVNPWQQNYEKRKKEYTNFFVIKLHSIKIKWMLASYFDQICSNLKYSMKAIRSTSSAP